MYKIFPSRMATFVDALGGGRLLPWRAPRHREFWALRDVDLQLGKGERLGIVGRNGAGKSTMLKLITGNLAATEGNIDVRGSVQALLDAGMGLHPEFTGHENIVAALTYQGLTRRQIEEATADIADFTELGGFLAQPFRTYSTGMQARLSFAVATTVRPDVLIVDEILGAGDAYFFQKSLERMRQLMATGASVLLVSHSLDHITRFCDRALWLERGRVVMDGDSLDVVKAYEQFTRELEERRLRAQNARTQSRKRDGFDRDAYTDYLTLRLTVPPGAAYDVTELALVRDGVVEDRVEVGDAQDADESQSAYVHLEGSDWSVPERSGEGYFRSVAAGAAPATAYAVFRLWFFYRASTYEVRVRRRGGDGPLGVEVSRSGNVLADGALEPSSEWITSGVVFGTSKEDDLEPGSLERPGPATSISRWRGTAGFRIAEVRTVDGRGVERTVFATGDVLSVLVRITATEHGRLPLIPAALVFRDDGTVVTRHVGEELLLETSPGKTFHARLDFGQLLLGDGAYLLSVGLYESLDADDIEPSTYYDYYDRSFEFAIKGNRRMHNELVHHPGAWSLEGVGAVELPGRGAAESAR